MSHTQNNKEILIQVNGSELAASAGDTIAKVLVEHGYLVLRYTERLAPRSLFCGMGVCFDCLVTVDGTPEIRACMTEVQNGMRIETGRAVYE